MVAIRTLVRELPLNFLKFFKFYGLNLRQVHPTHSAGNRKGAVLFHVLRCTAGKDARISLAQHVFLYFPHRVTRQFIHEKHALRLFEFGKPTF